MEIYNSEQEQVEALKAWWEKNGRSALTALVVFLAAVFGWQQWQAHRTGVAEAASTHYQRLVEMMEGDKAAAMESGRALIANYPDTVYAQMSSLVLAKLAVESGNLDEAAAHLRSVVEQGGQPEMVALARLRLARVELAQGNHEAALATLSGAAQGSESDELRGDILLAKGDAAGARAAYARAVEGLAALPDKRELVQMKLDDLATAAAAESSAE